VNFRTACSVIILAALATALLAAGPGPAHAGGPRVIAYRVTVLGSLGGSVSSSASISDAGLVSGYSNLPGDTARHVVVWREPMPMTSAHSAGRTVAWCGR
jgi:hypothetical protein